MVAQFETKITGDKAVISGLNRVGNAIGGRAIMPALRAAALIPQNAAKENVPVLTGTLKRSIHQEDVQGQLAVAVGTDVPYAEHVEFGTSKMPARPYLRPALDENKGAMVKEFGEAWSDIVEAAFR